jgi:GTPase SAR1 family protein
MCDCASSNINCEKNSSNNVKLKINTKEKVHNYYDVLFKVVLLGDSAVGKSTLLSMAVHGVVWKTIVRLWV